MKSELRWDDIDVRSDGMGVGRERIGRIKSQSVDIMLPMPDLHPQQAGICALELLRRESRCEPRDP